VTSRCRKGIKKEILVTTGHLYPQPLGSTLDGTRLRFPVGRQCLFILNWEREVLGLIA